MRPVQWLFVVSAMLFIGGIAFIIAAERTKLTAAPAAAPAAAAETKAVATVKQIMSGITSPTSTIVYDAVGTTVSASGTEEKAPKNDEEWAALAATTASLAESGNLLMTGGRAIDQGDWIKMSRALVDTSTVALKAAQAKNADAFLAAGSDINNTCDNCHAKYRRE